MTLKAPIRHKLFCVALSATSGIALTTTAITAQAQTWQCVDSSRHVYKVSQNVPTDRCKLISNKSPYADLVEPKIPELPQPSIGMSQHQVLTATSWGAPSRVHRTTSSTGIREQWVYSDSRFLYFEDGRLTTIQE